MGFYQIIYSIYASKELLRSLRIHPSRLRLHRAPTRRQRRRALPTNTRHRVWPERSLVVRRINVQHVMLYSSRTLLERRVLGALGVIAAAFRDVHLARLDVLAVDRAVEDGERRDRLVEGDFVSGVVDAHETELVALSHLAVDDVIRGGDVDVACFGEARSVDQVRDDLAAEVVAIVVGVARIPAGLLVVREWKWYNFGAWGRR